jgi:hypothetical protein
VSFFDAPPPADAAPAALAEPAWLGPPVNVMGRPTGLHVPLARSDSAAVVLRDVVAYPTGIELVLDVRRRDVDEGGPDDPFGFHGHRPGKPLPDAVLRFGVQLADGSKAVNFGPYEWADRAAREEPVLIGRGGGGGGGRWDMKYWLWPLPPAGSLEFVVEWPGEGIPETRREVDAGELRAAAQQAETLWPNGGGDGDGGGGLIVSRIG